MSLGAGRIPIFLSSAHYGLEDLRAELAAFLEDLGAEPLISSEKGFPDHRGIPPYAQCLRVLESALIVVGVIDKRYGARLADWGPYPQYTGLSPTHAELRHAVAEGKHLLVYIRSEVQGYYDIYRKNTSAFQNLNLPGNLEIGSLELFSELKHVRPAPWIEAFRDIRDIKHSVRSRLISYLAEALVQKERLAQAGAVTLLDRILKIEKPDLEAMSRVVDMLANLPEEEKSIFRLKLEKLYIGENLPIPEEIFVNQQTTFAAPMPVENWSAVELDILRVLFEGHHDYLRQDDIHAKIKLETGVTPMFINQILVSMNERGVVSRISGRHLTYWGLSHIGLQVCRQLNLGTVMPDESSSPRHDLIVKVADSNHALGSINRLIEISLDNSREIADRKIAIGVLAGSAKDWGDDIVRLLHTILLIETDKERLNLAAFVLSAVLRAKAINFTQGPPGNVLFVNDNFEDSVWFFDLIQKRGYVVVVESSEVGARQRFEAVKNGTESYALAIVDVMLPIKRLDKIWSGDELDDFFFLDSRSSGLRLLNYVRRELMLTARDLPIVCLTVREDEEVLRVAKELEVPLYSPDGSIRTFLEDALPTLPQTSTSEP
jgi:hypothetical protein